ncbi:Homocysteine S-methyltransferase [Paraphysoderma sedebokerense]|nr:Homocysteine S-methyltransferase [Paraphysoderma sedebokerense]
MPHPILLNPPYVLDGALATVLESKSHDITTSTKLWSSQPLITSPESIYKTHLSYLEAGTDIISTASYQSSIDGFLEQGLSRAEGEKAMRCAVGIAKKAVDDFSDSSAEKAQRKRNLLVALSLGPYGAVLCDGSEYNGSYVDRVSFDELVEFHLSRLRTFFLPVQQTPQAAGQGDHAPHPDIILFETIPALTEAKAIVTALRALATSISELHLQSRTSPNSKTVPTMDSPANLPPTLIAFSCGDSYNTSYGDKFLECFQYISSVASPSSSPNDSNDTPKVDIAGVGINCTHPSYIRSLLASLAPGSSGSISRSPDSEDKVFDVALQNAVKTVIEQSGLSVIVYPNQGERYDTQRRCWVEGSGMSDEEFSKLMLELVAHWGVEVVGGCCRTTPNTIKAIRENLRNTLKE